MQSDAWGGLADLVRYDNMNRRLVSFRGRLDAPKHRSRFGLHQHIPVFSFEGAGAPTNAKIKYTKSGS